VKIYQAEITKHILKLAGEDVPLEVIIEWTPQQVQKAEEWAAQRYAKTVDKLSVCVPRKPSFLRSIAS
jgi:hypothetical protein